METLGSLYILFLNNKMPDLWALSVMDDSEGATVVGNTDLTPAVVEAYYVHMSESIGFTNGYQFLYAFSKHVSYAPSYTFAVNGTVPFLSYDYYLDTDRAQDDVISDIYEVAISLTN